MSDEEAASTGVMELSPLWQLIHPYYNTEDNSSSEDDDEDEEDINDIAKNNNKAANDKMNKQRTIANEKALPEEKEEIEDATQQEMRKSSFYHAAMSHKRPVDYIKLSKRAPRLGKVIRMLAEIEAEEVEVGEEHNKDMLNDAEIDGEEELAQLVGEKDPVTGLTLLQWATLEGHFMLVQYLIKRLKRSAFAFPLDSKEIIIYNKWKEMQSELPSSTAIMEKRKMKESARAARLAKKAAALAAQKIRKNNETGSRKQRNEQELYNNNNDDDDEEEEDDEEDDEEDEEYDDDDEEGGNGNEELRMPEDIVYDALEEYIDEWGEETFSVGVVKRIGELGCYFGHRLPDGSKHGLGQSLYPNGDCYTGEYSGNTRHGRGVYVYHNTNSFYCGQWEHNNRHGYGYMCYSDGSHYLGYWLNNCKHGAGQYVYPDGSAYVGEWSMNVKHGQGRYIYTNGCTHVGAFYKNKLINGEWHLADGKTKYIGTFDAQQIPTGAGVFVHYGNRTRRGKFQEEGQYINGKWHPDAYLHTLPSSMHRNTQNEQPTFHNDFMEMEVHVPRQVHPKGHIKITFSPHCESINTITMKDVTRIANFAPLLQWIHDLPHVIDEIQKEICKKVQIGTNHINVHLSKVEVISFAYDNVQPDLLREVRAKPLFIDNNGIRHRIYASHNVTGKTRQEDEELIDDEGVLLFTHPITRVMVVLTLNENAISTSVPNSSLDEFRNGGVVLVEKCMKCNSKHNNSAQSATCVQLPTVTRSSSNVLEGPLISHIASALRLSLQKESSSSSSSVLTLIASTCLNPRVSPTTEEVLLYSQQCHPDCLAQIHSTLKAINQSMQSSSSSSSSSSSTWCDYMALPISQFVSTESDAMTHLAAMTYLDKKKQHMLPTCTVPPQRPPTPTLPDPLPRPALQPLYSAQALREAQERESDGELDDEEEGSEN